MKPTLALAIVTALHTALAAPAKDLNERSYGQITVWSDSYYRGSSQWTQIIGAGNSFTSCQAASDLLQDQTSSYQIYNGCCTLYVDSNCQGASNYHCSGPGGTFYFADLFGTGFNDAYSSWRCSSQY